MNTRLARVDGLRGLAILGVITVHCTILANALSPSALTFGKYGVQLFFLLSGYILCYVAHTKKSDWGTFFAKRFFRLAPLYYLTLLFCVLLGYSNPLEANIVSAPLDFKNIAIHLTFLHGLLPNYIRSILGVFWSLTPEVIFYGLFPFLNKLSVKHLSLVFGATLILAVLHKPLAYLIFSQTPTVSTWAGCSPFNNLYLFIWGMLVYKERAFFIQPIWKWAGALAIVLFMMKSVDILGSDLVFVNDAELYVALAFPSLVYACHPVVNAILENKPIQLLGKISYSAFFIHAALIQTFFHAGFRAPYPVVWGLIFLMTYLLSYISFRYIETPMIGVGHRLITHAKLMLNGNAT